MIPKTDEYVLVDVGKTLELISEMSDENIGFAFRHFFDYFSGELTDKDIKDKSVIPLLKYLKSDFQNQIDFENEFTKKGSRRHYRSDWKTAKVNDRNVPQYKVWRNAVFSRDDYTCQRCGLKGGKLNAHHIKRWAFYEELRFDVNNGITLCESCHRMMHRRRK